MNVLRDGSNGLTLKSPFTKAGAEYTLRGGERKRALPPKKNMFAEGLPQVFDDFDDVLVMDADNPTIYGALPCGCRSTTSENSKHVGLCFT